MSGLLHLQTTDNRANFRFPFDVQKLTGFQLQGGLAPLTPHQGLCPWTPLGAPPPDPPYRQALRARHVIPPLSRRNRRHWLRVLHIHVPTNQSVLSKFLGHWLVGSWICNTHWRALTRAARTPFHSIGQKTCRDLYIIMASRPTDS